MAHAAGKATVVGVTTFKAQCLGLIDAVVQGKTDRVVLLKHNRPVAAVVPIQEEGPSFESLWGSMRGLMTVAPGVDLTAPTDEVWEAEQ